MFDSLEISRWRMLFAVLIFFASTIYVTEAWTPSSYSLVLNSIGVASKPALGTAQKIRSDEYSVQTPYFQIAVHSNLGPIDRVSPYHETLKSFIALPTSDWTILFKPQLWGFLLLKPSHAYSLYYCVLTLAFILGWAAFLHTLRIPLKYALVGAVGLFFSQYIQVWWTSNAPVFAFAPWVGLAFLLPKSTQLRFLAVFYATTVWLFGLLYPPFLYSLGVVMTVSIVAFRNDQINWQSVLVTILAGLCAGAVVFFYMHDLIDIMRKTIYPGQRSVDGGTVPVVQVLQTFFPYFNTVQFSPALIAPQAINECEVGTVSSFLLLLVLCFSQGKSLSDFLRIHLRQIATFGVALAIIIGWMLLPIPSRIGHFLLLDMIPPRRLLLAFGFLANILILYAITRIQFSLSAVRLSTFFAIVIAATLLRKGDLPWAVLQQCWFDLVIIVLVAVTALILRISGRVEHSGYALTLAAVICNLATFGTFNPLQSAKPIFETPASPLVSDLNQLSKLSPTGFIALPGWYGATLDGLGINALNDTLLSPQIDFFSKMFSELLPDEQNYDFNRYAHVIPMFIARPQVDGDKLYIPLQKVADNTKLKSGVLDEKLSYNGSIDSYGFVRRSDGDFDIEAAGWGDFSEVSSGQSVLYAADSLTSQGIVRDLRPDVAQATSDPTMMLAGIRVYFKAHSIDRLTHLRLASFDPMRGKYQIPNLTELLVSEPQSTDNALKLIGNRGYLDSVTVDADGRHAVLSGWLPFPLREGQAIRIVLPAKVDAGRFSRVYREDLKKAIGSEWAMSGFRVELTLPKGTKLNDGMVCVVASDPSLGEAQLHSGVNKASCSHDAAARTVTGQSQLPAAPL